MSVKYTSLANHLVKSNQDMIRMTFDEVQNVIQGKLPPSAWKYQAWWSNSNTHSHARHGWMSAGYETSKVDLDAQELVFYRTGSGGVSPKPIGKEYPRMRREPGYGRSSGDPRLDEIVRSAGGVANLAQISSAIQQYIDGDLLETELGRILRKLWPRNRS